MEAAIRHAGRGRDDIVYDVAGADDHRWHDSVAERQAQERSFDPGDKRIISGIRRLPWWVLSRIHYEAARPPHRCATREMLCRGQFYERDGGINHADAQVGRLSTQTIHGWVRLEHLAEDFVDQFEGLLGPRVRSAAQRLRKVVNPTTLDYVKSLDFYFTPGELAGLYEANPIWAHMERQVYGDLLRL
ncbi:hypothetical protein [Phenylobacterium sp.]|uniref:hypothetical protein n=1 Tax=Phenylobacterium sp. TaxID=1871053 RepID=UPI0025EB3FE0|nr:hypothetical protein [Phenylobacterium sp.]